MNRNFDKFEVGHWYVYTGTDKHSCFVRGQEFVLDHKANKCIKASNVYRADFDRGHSDTSLPFTWEGLGKNNCFDNWIEVEDPTTAHDITSGEYFYVYRNNKIIISAAPTCSIESNSTIYYKLVRPPYGESKMENKKEGFIPKKVKLSDNDDIWIECARFEELPCECYRCDGGDNTLLSISSSRISTISTISSIYLLSSYESKKGAKWNYAIPKARADEALKFVSNVKLSDLKPGVKVKIKEDAMWMDRYNPTPFKKGGIYTVESTDNNDWGIWSDTIKGAVTLKESEDYRFPIHWIEKIVDEKEEISNMKDKIYNTSSKIKISELKNKTDYAVYVKSNEERIKFMSAVGKNWNNGYGIEVNKCSYPNYLTIRHDNSGILHTGGNTITDLTIYTMSDIDFEEDKVYIKGTDFYIGEKVRIKNIKDISFKQAQILPCASLPYGKCVTIEKNFEEPMGRYNCFVVDRAGWWHTDWFEHIDDKNVNVSDSSLKVEVEGHCLNKKVFEELFIYPKHKTKYIKLNKKPIKKGKEYKVHKKEYIPLNKK